MLEAAKEGWELSPAQSTAPLWQNLHVLGTYDVFYIFHNPNQLQGMPSSNCCELGAIQTQPKALVNYLGKYSFNLVLTSLETQEPNFCLQ